LLFKAEQITSSRVILSIETGQTCNARLYEKNRHPWPLRFVFFYLSLEKVRAGDEGSSSEEDEENDPNRAKFHILDPKAREAIFREDAVSGETVS